MGGIGSGRGSGGYREGAGRPKTDAVVYWVRVKPETRNALKAIAKERRKRAGELVDEMLEEWLNRGSENG